MGTFHPGGHLQRAQFVEQAGVWRAARLRPHDQVAAREQRQQQRVASRLHTHPCSMSGACSARPRLERLHLQAGCTAWAPRAQRSEAEGGTSALRSHCRKAAVLACLNGTAPLRRACAAARLPASALSSALGAAATRAYVTLSKTARHAVSLWITKTLRSVSFANCSRATSVQQNLVGGVTAEVEDYAPRAVSN